MPISEPEWASISRLIEKIVGSVSGDRSTYFITGLVVKRNEAKKLVWMKEFGDQPIPVVGFRYSVKYYDETPSGTLGVAVGAAQPFKTRTKKVIADVIVPEIGEAVLVVRELGSRRLPRCLGVIQGQDWLVMEEE